MAPDAPAKSTRMCQRYRAVYCEFAKNWLPERCALFGGEIFRYCYAVYAISEQTRARFLQLSALVHDVDGTLTPTILPGTLELEFEHGLFLHPCALRTIAMWVD